MGVRNRLFSCVFPEVIAAGALRRLPPSTGIVLMYHEVLPDEITFPAWLAVAEGEFRWQMRYLRRHFDVVSINQAIERVSARGQATRPFAVVTFDDGYRGNLLTVLPIMESMGLPFTVYVATAAIVEERQYWHDRIINLLNAGEDVEVSLTAEGVPERFTIPGRGEERRRWEAVQRLLVRLKEMAPAEREEAVSRIAILYREVPSALQMLTPHDLERLSRSNCVTVGSHTHRHELLHQLPPDEVHLSLRTAHAHISRITGKAPTHFAYPNGDFNEAVRRQVGEAGYQTAVTTTRGRWSANNHPLQIPRLAVGRFDSRSRFRAMTSGYL